MRNVHAIGIFGAAVLVVLATTVWSATARTEPPPPVPAATPEPTPQVGAPEMAPLEGFPPSVEWSPELAEQAEGDRITGEQIGQRETPDAEGEPPR